MIVFVHGNPETAAIWDPLIAALCEPSESSSERTMRFGRDDIVTLSPPGFGAPTPAGWGATSDEYLAWLIGEVEQLDGPVDLVGHDWGGGHVERLAATRPDLIRSWVTDIAGTADPEYVWHDMAQVWQTPGAGEEAVAGMAALPVDDRTGAFVGVGMTEGAARSCAEAADAEMGRCILALYRSAAQPKMTEWGAELEAAERRPALVIIATEDHYTGGEALARRSAERFGAEVAVLPGLGHWWMLEDPDAGAAVLRNFFATL
jgi:pimeloyl-ACP methyl ester carboxylesterase